MGPAPTKDKPAPARKSQNNKAGPPESRPHGKRWTKLEIDALAEAVKRYDDQPYIPWVVVAKTIPGRDDKACKNCYERYIRPRDGISKVSYWQADETSVLLMLVLPYKEERRIPWVDNMQA